MLVVPGSVNENVTLELHPRAVQNRTNRRLWEVAINRLAKLARIVSRLSESPEPCLTSSGSWWVRSLQLGSLTISVSSLRVAIMAAVVAILLFASGGEAREPGSVVGRMSTLERVDQPGWWPTKMLASDKDYVGSEACAKCHATVSASFKKAEMSKALLRAADSEVLRKHEGNTFHLESYTYKLETTAQVPQFSVSQGPESRKMPIT